MEIFTRLTPALSIFKREIAREFSELLLPLARALKARKALLKKEPSKTPQASARFFAFAFAFVARFSVKTRLKFKWSSMRPFLVSV